MLSGNKFYHLGPRLRNHTIVLGDLFLTEKFGVQQVWIVYILFRVFFLTCESSGPVCSNHINLYLPDAFPG